jgi:hypothetical protein
VTPSDSGPYDAVPISAGPDGTRFFWGSAGVGDPAGEDGGAGSPDAFIARRGGGGWTTEWLTKTPPSAAVARGVFLPATGSDSLLFLPWANLVPEDQNNTDQFGAANYDLYRADSNGPTLLSGAGSNAMPVPPRWTPSTPDQSIVAFSTPDSLHPDDQDSAEDLYRYSPSGTTLLSRQVDGTADNSGIGAFIGTPTAAPSSLSRSDYASQHGLGGMSEDGSTVVMSTDEALDPVNDTDGGATDLYLWRNGAVSLISDPAGAPTFDPATFAGMSADGETIYVQTVESLLPADGDAELDVYRYRPLADPADRLALATPGGALPVYPATVSRNGALFFATEDRLGSDPPPAGPEAVIYRTTAADGVRTVSAIAPWGNLPTDDRAPEYSPESDSASTYPNYFFGLVSVAATNSNWGIGMRPVRASHDGSALVFVTSGSLLPTDGDVGSPDVYLWRAGSGVTLVSQGGSGSYPAVIGASVPPGGEGEAVTYGQQGGRVIDATASKVYFTSAEPLTADASDNGVPKVFEWNNGTLSLVTPKRDGTGPALYVDNSASGDDVFFRTADTLTGWDADGGQIDIYDARVGGGFPEPPVSDTGGPASPGGPSGGVPSPPALPSTTPSVEPPLLDPITPGDGEHTPAEVSFDANRVERDGKRLSVPVEASVPGRLRAVLRDADGRALARGNRNVRSAGESTITLKLTKLGRRVARKGNPLRGSLRIVLTPRDSEQPAVTDRDRVNVATSVNRRAEESR